MICCYYATDATRSTGVVDKTSVYMLWPHSANKQVRELSVGGSLKLTDWEVSDQQQSEDPLTCGLSVLTDRK